METVPPTLPEGYYLTNFFKILDFVETHHATVLNPQEQAFIANFKQLSIPAQRLYVRLISRRRELFRLDKLSYTEIPDIEGHAEELTDARFMDTNPP